MTHRGERVSGEPVPLKALSTTFLLVTLYCSGRDVPEAVRMDDLTPDSGR